MPPDFPWSSQAVAADSTADALARVRTRATGCAFDAPSPGISAGGSYGTLTLRGQRNGHDRENARKGFSLRRAAVSTTVAAGGPSAPGRRSASGIVEMSPWKRRHRARRVRGSGVPSGARPRRYGAPPFPARRPAAPRRDRGRRCRRRGRRVGRARAAVRALTIPGQPPESPFHRYQSVRLGPVRPTVATRATKGWPRNPSRSKPSSTVHVVLAPPSAMQR